MTERAWVLRRGDGKYFCEARACIVVSPNDAKRFKSSEDAQTTAQIVASGHRGSFPFLYAIPIERETERVVEEIEGPAELYVLKDRSGDYVVNHCNTLCIGEAVVLDVLRAAKTFSVSDILASGGLGTSDFTPIPVQVTETPGEWREVEDES